MGSLASLFRRQRKPAVEPPEAVFEVSDAYAEYLEWVAQGKPPLPPLPILETEELHGSGEEGSGGDNSPA